jgi:hypothetical protein
VTTPSNDLAPLSPFRSWLDCTTNTSGYDFRKGQARIIGNEVALELLEAAKHDDVFHHTGGWPAADPRQLEAVPVQVQRVDFVAGVAKLQPLATPFLQLREFC